MEKYTNLSPWGSLFLRRWAVLLILDVTLGLEGSRTLLLLRMVWRMRLRVLQAIMVWITNLLLHNVALVFAGQWVQATIGTLLAAERE